MFNSIYSKIVRCFSNVILGTCDITGSLGEGHIYIINKILRDQDNQVILLDEWNASLDEYNVHKINEQLNSLSSHKLIVEVRHKNQIKQGSLQFIKTTAYEYEKW